MTSRSGDYIITVIMILFLGGFFSLFGLYVFGIIKAGVISILFTIINFVSPVIVTVLIFYY